MRLTRIGITFCMFLVMGCGVSNYDQGRTFLKQGQFDAAIAYFKAAIDEGIGIEEAYRELGIAYYRKGGFKEAIDHLQIGFDRDSKDDRAALFLGMALERENMYEQAIEVYQKYLRLVSADKIRQQIRGRLALLKNQSLIQLAKAAIVQEEEIDVDEIPENTVGVRYFELISGREELAPFQKGIADLVITDLTRVEQLRVVERTRLQVLIDAMELEQDAIFDPAHSNRMGRLLGASNIFTGTIEGLQDLNIRLNASYARVKTGTVDAASIREDLEEKIFDLEKAIVFDILDALGIVPTAAEKKAIEKKETENLLAFLAYTQGLEATDGGDYATAIREFQRAVEEDAGFELAKRSKSEAELLNQAITQDLQAFETQIVETSRSAAAISQRFDQMDAGLTKDFMPFAAAAGPHEGDTDLPETPVTVTVER